MSRPRVVPLAIALSVAGGLLAAAPASAEPAAAKQLIVAVAADDAAETVAALDAQVAVLDGDIVDAGVTTVQVAAQDTAEATAALAADPRVAYVEVDAVARVLSTPSDPLYGQQWGTQRADVPEVWDTTAGDDGVVVAVIDTGVVQSHPDLAGASFTAGWDFINDDADPIDDHGHGTAAAGVIAAQHNGSGTAGVCPDCTIMPLKAMDADGTGSHSAIAAAINHAVANDADIINLSLGSEASTLTLQNAVRRASELGVLVIAAAGNAGTTTVFYPAGYQEAIGVAASQENDTRYSWSNSGSWVELAAPGCNLAPSFDADTASLGYGHFCGTSSASPFVAGVAGLLLSAHPTTNASVLRTALSSSAVGLSYVSAGRVDAAAADRALTTVDAVPDPDSGGEVIDPDPTDPGDESKADTATDVSPSTSEVTYGQAVQIGGQLSTAEPSGAQVTLLQQPAGTADWVELDAQTTDAAGAVEFTYAPDRNAAYRLRFEGDEGRSGSLSDSVTITVRPDVRVAVPTAVLAGRSYTITGTVAPARQVEVQLQRKTPDGWKVRDRQTVSSQGRYAFMQSATVGKRRFRVVFDGDEVNAGATSDVAVVRGDRVAIRRVKADAKGADRRNLNGEFLVLTNNGRAPVELEGWGVRSRSTGRTYRLEAYRLRVGRTVVVHSGAGDTRTRHVHLAAGRQVLRNRHDVAVVKHAAGGVADRVRW